MRSGARGITGISWLQITGNHLLEFRSFMKKRQGSHEGAKTRRKPPILEIFASSRESSGI